MPMPVPLGQLQLRLLLRAACDEADKRGHQGHHPRV
jgi:hypothetical protein